MLVSRMLGQHQSLEWPVEILMLAFESTVRKAFKPTLGDILRGQPKVDVRKGRKVSCRAGILTLHFPSMQGKINVTQCLSQDSSARPKHLVPQFHSLKSP